MPPARIELTKCAFISEEIPSEENDARAGMCTPRRLEAVAERLEGARPEPLIKGAPRRVTPCDNEVRAKADMVLGAWRGKKYVRNASFFQIWLPGVRASRPPARGETMTWEHAADSGRAWGEKITITINAA